MRLLACVCVCVCVCTVWRVKSLFMVSVCSCVCVSFSSAGKKVALFSKSPVCIFLNDGYLLYAHNSMSQFLRSLSEDIQREWVTLTRTGCSACFLQYWVASLLDREVLTVFNNERINVWPEFLGAWGLPFRQLCIARSTEYHSWQAKRNPQKFVIKSKKKNH